MFKQLFPLAFLLTCLAVSANAQSGDVGKVYWRGDVDDTVRLTITGITLTETTVSGRQMEAGSYSFTARLPESDVTVRVNRIDGRGQVSIVQQPLSENNYTAIIEIRDERGGSDVHMVEISWQKP